MSKWLNEIEQRAAKATPGPWKAETWCSDWNNAWSAVGPIHEQSEEEDELNPDTEASYQAERDAAFIAAARNDIPALLSTILALKKMLQEAAEWDRLDDVNGEAGRIAAIALSRLERGPLK